MPHRLRLMDEHELNLACERHIRDVLDSQVRQLEALGMGHIAYADNARLAIEKIDALICDLTGQPQGCPARRAEDRPRFELLLGGQVS